MTLSTFILMMITSTFMLLLSTTPIMLGMNILIMSLLLSVTFASIMSSWFAFLIFLIYVGGMLVMFAYFLALTPNQHMTSSNILFHSIFSMTVFSFILMSTEMKIPSLTQFYQGNSTLYLINTSPFIIILAMILMLTMIIVVKTTLRSKGPLRPFY